MPLVAGIRAFLSILQDVDGRDKCHNWAGHDGWQIEFDDDQARLRFTFAIFSSTAQTAAVSCAPSPLASALR